MAGIALHQYNLSNKGTEKVYRLGVTLSGETEGYRAASGFDQQKLNFNPVGMATQAQITD